MIDGPIHRTVNSYASTILYLRDPNKIRAACINEYGKPPNMPNLRRMLAKKEATRQFHWSHSSDKTLGYSPERDSGVWGPNKIAPPERPKDTRKYDGRVLYKTVTVEANAEPVVLVVQDPIGKRIIDAVALKFDITLKTMYSKPRIPHLVAARSVAARLLREQMWEDGSHHFSYPMIGRMLGGRDHSTIIHLCRTFDQRAARHPAITEVYQQVKEALGQ